MDYTQVASNQMAGIALGRAGQVMPELGRLKAAAERVARARSQVESFIERFNGPLPTGTSAAAPQPTDNYRNDLDSLFVQIECLETAVTNLEQIG